MSDAVQGIELAVLALHEASARTENGADAAAWRLVLAGGYDARLAENREYFEQLDSQVRQLGLSNQVCCWSRHFRDASPY
jgi:hypothetical protein